MRNTSLNSREIHNILSGLSLLMIIFILFGCGGGGSGSNGGAAASTVAAPAFSLQAGAYRGSQTVSLSTATNGASIRYTIDGSTPSSTTGNLYSGTIVVLSTTTIKAIACEDGMNPSRVASATYTIARVGDGSSLSRNLLYLKAGAPSNILGSSTFDN
jgi:Chitobiase/beta-hexosaminidase C-terminal domain